MPYVEIDQAVNVIALYGRPQPGNDAVVLVDESDPRLEAFLNPPVTQADYLAAVGKLLDTAVQERFYDNIVSACSYAASTNAKFKSEADSCVAWRDAVYVACYAALAAVQAGTMAQPSVADFVASLPKLTWPQVV